MADAFTLNAARRNPLLFRLVRRFNTRLACDLHPSWLAAPVGPTLWGRLVRSDRGARWLESWARTRFALAEAGWWDFAEPRLRVALLPPAALDRLVTFTGAALLRKQVAGAIQRDAVARLREGLGDEAYAFATKRASVLVRVTPPECERIVLDDSPARQLREVGLRALATCLTGSPAEVRTRLSLKLPREGGVLEAAPLAGGEPGALFALVRRIIGAEVAPELSPCFI